MPRMSEQRRTYIRDAIRAGISVVKIKAMFGTSVGTILKLKRELGIPILQQRKRKGIEWQHTEVAPEPTVSPNSYLERVKELEKRGFTPSLEDITSEDEQPDTPQTYTPQEYFEAIADGLRQRDAEINTLRLERDRLRAENQKLLSDLSQCKLQMANWTGPSVLPGRSLGNGG